MEQDEKKQNNTDAFLKWGVVRVSGEIIACGCITKSIVVVFKKNDIQKWFKR